MKSQLSSDGEPVVVRLKDLIVVRKEKESPKGSGRFDTEGSHSKQAVVISHVSFRY